MADMSHTQSTAQLLETVLAGGQRVHIPCICPGGMMNMMTEELMEVCGIYWPQAHTDPLAMAELACASYTQGLFDNIGVPFCMTVEAEAMGAAVDLGNRCTEPRVTGYTLATAEQWRELRPIDLNAGRPRVVLEALEQIRRRYPEAAVIGNLTGPVSLASSLVEPNTYYKELRKQPEAAHALMDFATDQLIVFGKAQIAAGAAFIAVSDPSGTGEILGPKLFAEYALPCLNRICQALSPLCCGVIVHICGRVHTIYSQLRQLESDALSVDAIVNLGELRQQVPGKIIMGNVSTFALADGKESAIRTLCRTALRNGADILAPACGLGTTTTLTSIRLLREEAEMAGSGGRPC